jgi:hypothetical protein
MKRTRYHIEDYTIGWVCALPIQLATMAEMLDEEHQDIPLGSNDTNLYTLGRISQTQRRHRMSPSRLTQAATGERHSRVGDPRPGETRDVGHSQVGQRRPAPATIAGGRDIERGR